MKEKKRYVLPNTQTMKSLLLAIGYVIEEMEINENYIVLITNYDDLLQKILNSDEATQFILGNTDEWDELIKIITLNT